MNALRIAPFVVLACLGGCGEPARAQDEPGAVPPVTEQLVLAFRRYVYRYFEARYLAEEGGSLEGEVRAAEADLSAAREALGEAMVAAGIVSASGQSDLAEMVPALERHFARLGDLVFVPTGPEDVLLGRVASRTAGLSRTILGREVRYHRVVVGEILVLDYARYRSTLGGAAAPVQAVAWRGDTVYLLRPEAERIGRDLFFPRAAYYRETARRIAEEGALTEAIRESDDALFALLKDALRWRSLGDFYRGVETLPEDARVAAFADRYLAEEETLAAAYLCAAAEAGGTEADPVRLARRAHLARLAEGDPAAELATLFALVLQGLLAEPRTPTGADGVPPAALPAEVLAAAQIVRAIPRIARAFPAEAPALAAAALGSDRACWAALLDAPEPEIRALGRRGAEADAR